MDGLGVLQMAGYLGQNGFLGDGLCNGSHLRLGLGFYNFSLGFRGYGLGLGCSLFLCNRFPGVSRLLCQSCLFYGFFHFFVLRFRLDPGFATIQGRKNNRALGARVPLLAGALLH
jgi:hypothetical protein